MRTVLKKLLIVVAIFFAMYKVNAEEIVCDYGDLKLSGTDKTTHFTMTWDVEKPFDRKSNPYIQMGEYNSSQRTKSIFFWRYGKEVSLTKDAEIDQNLYKDVLNNYGCNDYMYVCVYFEASIDSIIGAVSDPLAALLAWDLDKLEAGKFVSKLLIMTESEYKSSKYKNFEGGEFYMNNGDKINDTWRDGYDFGDVTSTVLDFFASLLDIGEDSYIYAYKETSCTTVRYDGPYVGVNINCGILKRKLIEYMQIVQKYSACTDLYCKSEKSSKLVELEDNIKSQCKAMLQSYDYSAGQKHCIDDCVKIKDILDSYKEGTDLVSDSSSSSPGACGFSARLVAWIILIVRWIRYIIPILVIVLGILDFIKAVGTDKDDEMKKAQKHFIIRLIAAALIFVIPYILEFIITRFGFAYEDCGLF